MMKYDQLSQDERDDVIAEALYEREREHFHYALNVATFQATLAGLPLSADTWVVGNNNEPYKAYLERLISEHEVEMAKVERTHAALDAQLIVGPARNAAIARVAAKRKATPPPVA